MLWKLSTRDSHFPKSLLLSHYFMGDSQSVLWLWLTVSGFDCIASLAQYTVLLGQTQDPPSGPTTKSKASRSQSLFVLVWGTQSSSQRNPSLKWNISMGAFVALSDTNILSSVNNHCLYTTIWSLIPLVISQYFSQLNFLLRFFTVSLHSVTLLPPFPPFGPIFHSIFIGQINSTPLFYMSMSSPLLWEWPVFCKRSGDLQHVGLVHNHCEGLFRPAQTGSQKQVTAPKHCPKCWICVCVCNREKEKAVQCPCKSNNRMKQNSALPQPLTEL